MLVPALEDRFAPLSAEADDSPVLRVLGEAKTIISELSLMQADIYYHGGLSVECPRSNHIPDAGAAHEHHDEQMSGRGNGGSAPFGPLFWLYDKIRIADHIHLERDEEKEIIPWLYYSLKTDPRNVQAVTLAAYYLAARLGRIDEALAVLREGRRDNPESWQIYAETGKIYCVQLGDYNKALFYLSRAEELMHRSEHDKFQERYVLTLLGKAYEGTGRYEDALANYRKVRSLFPLDSSARKKMETMKGNKSENL